jgi:hypothetical protein
MGRGRETTRQKQEGTNLAAQEILGRNLGLEAKVGVGVGNRNGNKTLSNTMDEIAANAMA